jgi:hypothetical protein
VNQTCAMPKHFFSWKKMPKQCTPSVSYFFTCHELVSEVNGWSKFETFPGNDSATALCLNKWSRGSAAAEHFLKDFSPIANHYQL